MKKRILELDKPNIGRVCTFDESSTNAGYISAFGNIIMTTLNLNDLSLTLSLQLKANKIKNERKQLEDTNYMTDDISTLNPSPISNVHRDFEPISEIDDFSFSPSISKCMQNI